MKRGRWPMILILILVVSFVFGVWLRSKFDVQEVPETQKIEPKTVI